MAQLFDLNIERFLENWDVSDGIREIIANAFDEQNLTKTEEIRVHWDSEHNLHIRDFGRGIHYKHFTQSENKEKLDNPQLIGKFGVGLKDALSVFDRHNINVKIFSKYGVVTLSRIAKNGFDDVFTLHANIEEPIDRNMKGTDFVLSNVTEDSVNEAKSRFLHFSNLEMLEQTRFGDVYPLINGKSNIYINGVLVATEENFLFSYNITSKDNKIRKELNRERSYVGRSAYSDSIKKILLKCQMNSVIRILLEDLRQKSRRQSVELSWNDIAVHAVKEMNKQGNIVFMSQSNIKNQNPLQREIIEESGKDIVYVPDEILSTISNQKDYDGKDIVTIEKIFDYYSKSFSYKFVLIKDLTEEERKVYDNHKWAIDFLNAKAFKNKIMISEVLRPSFSGNTSSGIWDKALQKIIIKRDQLVSNELFLSSLIPLIIQAMNNVSIISRDFENELARIIGILAGTSVSETQEKKTFFSDLFRKSS